MRGSIPGKNMHTRKVHTMSTTFDRIVNDARALGIHEGDTVLVHSSMKSLQITDSPVVVIDALQAAVGDTGTMLFPALSFSTVNQDNSFFSYHDTPVCIGLLAETFRHQPGVFRSMHPTHSVCARGARAEELTGDHVLDNTPVGVHSPYRKLPALGGKILMLGCGMGPNTFMHGVEEAAEAPYLLLPEPWHYTMEDRDRNRFEVDHFRHGISRFGDQNYKRAAEILEGDEVLHGNICAAECHLIDTAALMRRGVEAIRKDPYFFLNLHANK